MSWAQQTELMKDKNNMQNKLKRLFADKSTNLDIKDISETNVVEDHMAKQWDATDIESTNLEQKQRIWEQIINKTNAPKKRRPQIRYMLRDIAAAVAIFIVFAVVYKMTFKDNNTFQTMLEVHSGSSMEYTLPDSSKVWMQPGTFIRFDKEFDGSRDVWTNGKVIFEVTKNKNRPFIVHLKNASIKVLGTSFSVLEMENDRNKIEVILHSGLVEFINELSGEKSALKPHEKLVFDPKNGNLTIEQYSTINWLDGRYTFDNVRVENLVTTLNDLYKTTIILGKNVNPSHRITGSIKYDEPLEDVINKICYSLKTDYVKQHNQIVIK